MELLVESGKILLLNLYPLAHLCEASTQYGDITGTWLFRQSLFPCFWIFVWRRPEVGRFILSNLIVEIVLERTIRGSGIPFSNDSCDLLGDILLVCMRN
jgi:hypothetical protein